MAAPNSPSPNPFDDVREAFAGLDTSEKAAFVFEATFATIGQALHETGRRVSEAIDDLNIDDWFRTPPEADFGAPPPPPRPKKPAPRAKTTRKPPPPPDTDPTA